MHDHSHIFEFERDFAGTLHCMPMAVRMKLDQCGVKLSLRQWNRLSVENRHDLLQMPCATSAEAEAYRGSVTERVARDDRGEGVRLMEVDAHPAWGDPAHVPQQVADFAALRGVPAPEPRQWAALSDLQRFVLMKLTRAGHDNVNFVPALREFGLLSSST